MIDVKELRRLAEDAKKCYAHDPSVSNHAAIKFERRITPATIIELLDDLELLRKQSGQATMILQFTERDQLALKAADELDEMIFKWTRQPYDKEPTIYNNHIEKAREKYRAARGKV